MADESSSPSGGNPSGKEGAEAKDGNGGKNAADGKATEIMLKVAEAMQIDYGKRIVRIDSDARQVLALTTGDIVEIKGKKFTAAIVLPSHPADEGAGIVRLDGLLRQNAGVGLGDRVAIKKAEVKPAKKIVLAPNSPSRYAPGFDQYVKKNLMGKPLSKGDILSVNVFGTPFPFAVAQLVPQGIAIVADETEIILKEEPLKELGKIATISYEDVGGLKEEVRKIREMVELPIRHPELFERLGIEPPRGVLIYGPPGCGKTLLAKAVANESEAHFITIAGPEVVCVTGETPVYLADGGVKQIRELFEECAAKSSVSEKGGVNGVDANFEVLAVDGNLKVIPARATHVLKLQAPEIYKVSTKRGLEANASKNQPFAVLDESGKLVWTRASEIKAGQIIAAPRVLPVKEKEHFFGLKAPGSKVIARTNAGEKVVSECSEEELARAQGFKFNGCKSNLSRSIWATFPAKNSTEFMEFLGMMASEGSISARMDEIAFANLDGALKNRFKELSSKLFGIPSTAFFGDKEKICFSNRVVAEFLTECACLYKGKKPDGYTMPHYCRNAPIEGVRAFLGAYLDGDGTVSLAGNGTYATPIYLSKSRRMLSDLQFMLLRLGMSSKILDKNTSFGKMLALSIEGTESRRMFAKQIPVRSAAKAAKLKLLERAVKLGDDETIGRLPVLRRCKENLRLTYEKTLPEGEFERYVSGRDPATFRKLGKLLPFLENRVGELEQAKAEFEKAKQLLNAQALPAPAVAAGFCFVHENSLAQAQAILANLWKALAIREAEVSHECLMKAKYYLRYGAKARTPAPLLELCEGIEKIFIKSDLPNTAKTVWRMRALYESELLFDEVKAVELKEGEEVYDVSVETHSNFIGGNVPTLLHNSKFVGEAEEKLRNIFKEAEENAPTIIFIDELDSIAPKREDVAGEVEKRIVAQLLSLMDGLKSRGQVVILAATNRPNAIDPALRRPGRFDREIEIGAPDKRARKEMLQIHTRGMPLWNFEQTIYANCLIDELKLTFTKENIEPIIQKYRRNLELQIAAIEEQSNQLRDKEKQILAEISAYQQQLGARSTSSKPNANSPQVLAVIRESIDGLLRQSKDLQSRINKSQSDLNSIMEDRNRLESEGKNLLSQLSVIQKDIEFVVKSKDLLVTELEAAVKNVEQTDYLIHLRKGDIRTIFYKRTLSKETVELVSLIQKGLDLCFCGQKLINAEEVVHNAEEKSIEFLKDELASTTHGFVGADMQMLCKEAAMKSLQRILPDIKLGDEAVPQKILDELKVEKGDFFNALKEVFPSALREVYIEVPNVKWEQIGGLEDVKREIKEAVELPLKHPEKFEKLGIRPVRGILLFGHPGTGKTLLAKAVATESEANFIAIRGPELINKYVGESEKGIREIFRKARSAAPCIIFIDEMDAIVPIRGTDEGTHVTERMVNQLLTEIDGIQNLKDIVVIGATNRPDIIDPAVLRPGRFDKLIQIPMPDEQTRLAVLKVHSSKMPLAKDVNFAAMAKATEGYSGADLEALCREAGMHALRENAATVNAAHFQKSLSAIRPSLLQKKPGTEERAYG